MTASPKGDINMICFIDLFSTITAVYTPVGEGKKRKKRLAVDGKNLQLSAKNRKFSHKQVQNEPAVATNSDTIGART